MATFLGNQSLTRHARPVVNHTFYSKWWSSIYRERPVRWMENNISVKGRISHCCHWRPQIFTLKIAIKKAIIQIKFILPGLLGICRMDLKLFRQSNLIHIINRIQITHIERNEFLSLPLTSLSIRKIKLLIF